MKRHDAYTLETEDGIIVIIQGMINRERMQSNGFPPEVCGHFGIFCAQQVLNAMRCSNLCLKKSIYLHKFVLNLNFHM